MYCNYCGTQNPDDFRFCQSCGKPRAGAAPAVAPTNTNDVLFVRSICLNAAAEYEKRPEEVRNPLRLIELEKNSSRFRFLLNPSDEQISDLVWLNRFSDAEKAMLDRDVMIFITYLRMLWDIGEAYECPKLVQGVFLVKTYVYYQSNLSAFVKDKDWEGYDEVTTEYLEDGRKAKVTLLLTRALVKAAHAKYMRGDRRAARQLLDEFYRIADAAQRERPAYTTLSDNDARLFFLAVKNEADSLKRLV